MSVGTRGSKELPLGILLAISSGGLGLLRPASGSWGSLPPACLAVLIAWSGAPWWVAAATLALLVVLGSIACLRFGEAAEEALGAKDPSTVVADETAGCALTLLVVPWWILLRGDDGDVTRAIIAAATGFFFFRLFDVWKPGPIASLQSRPGGAGILLDDLAAAAFSWPPVLLGCSVAMQVTAGSH